MDDCIPKLASYMSHVSILLFCLYTFIIHATWNDIYLAFFSPFGGYKMAERRLNNLFGLLGWFLPPSARREVKELSELLLLCLFFAISLGPHRSRFPIPTFVVVHTHDTSFDHISEIALSFLTLSVQREVKGSLELLLSLLLQHFSHFLKYF